MEFGVKYAVIEFDGRGFCAYSMVQKLLVARFRRECFKNALEIVTGVGLDF